MSAAPMSRKMLGVISHRSAESSTPGLKWIYIFQKTKREIFLKGNTNILLMQFYNTTSKKYPLFGVRIGYINAVVCYIHLVPLLVKQLR